MTHVTVKLVMMKGKESDVSVDSDSSDSHKPSSFNKITLKSDRKAGRWDSYTDMAKTTDKGRYRNLLCISVSRSLR